MALSEQSSSHTRQPPLTRADEVEDLLSAVQQLIIPFIRAADDDAAVKHTGHGLQQPGQGPRTALIEHHPPHKLQSLLGFSLPDKGQGKDGLLKAIEGVLQYSVNTWDQGFLDKLYASITPVGLAADLVLSTLNTNLHVYQVAPALISIEKQTGRALAELFGLNDAHAGGVTQPGGSAANLTSIVIARNNLHPLTKTDGYAGKRFVLFTSAHGHYSVEKAAQMLGFGSKAVKAVAVDAQGRMIPQALQQAIVDSQTKGEIPFYVNATAGTTVLGSWDPLVDISTICKQHSLWLHVDASWGGPVIFSSTHRHKLNGSDKADSIALCPHKMLNVPITCTFLLGRDLRQFHKAMTLPAGYLFHDEAADQTAFHSENVETMAGRESDNKDIWDLAELTPQCGRRGDSLKLALSWVFYGSDGFGKYIDKAFDAAAYLTSLLASNSAFDLVSVLPPPCLQVCFYYRKSDKSKNDTTTQQIARSLMAKGFMIDFAPGEDGKFFRVVVNGQTRRETLEGLVKAIEGSGVNV